MVKNALAAGPDPAGSLKRSPDLLGGLREEGNEKRGEGTWEGGKEYHHHHIYFSAEH